MDDLEIEKGLIDAVLLEQDVRAFMASSVYKHLCACADYERGAALISLSMVSPSDTKEITALQNTVWRCNSFKSWLEEALETGRQSREILSNE